MEMSSLGSNLGECLWGEWRSTQNTGDPRRGGGAQKTSSVHFTWNSIALIQIFPAEHSQTPQPPPTIVVASESVYTVTNGREAHTEGKVMAEEVGRRPSLGQCWAPELFPLSTARAASPRALLTWLLKAPPKLQGGNKDDTTQIGLAVS